MTPTTCPHGLPPSTCQICRLLEPAAVPGSRAPAGRGRLGGNLAVVAIVAVLGFALLGWLAAAFFAVLRILELLAVAAVAGWLGFKAGVLKGKRQR